MAEDDYLWRTKPGQERDLVERWIYNPALRELVEMEGGEWPTGTLEEVVEALVEFSVVWDKRQGQSRLIFHDDEESRVDERAQLVYSAAERLGLMYSAPPTMTAPDYLLILGGLATGVEPRVRYAAELVESGRVTPGTIVGLGSFRQLQERELPVAKTYAPGALHEIDLLQAMMGSVFGVHQWTISCDDDPALGPSRSARVLRSDQVPPLSVMAARSGSPESRPPNTADTYRQLADIEDLDDDQHLLLITSTIYRPYQHCVALAELMLVRSLNIETIGVPSSCIPSQIERSGPEVTDLSFGRAREVGQRRSFGTVRKLRSGR